jgi:hypothetical protein
VAVSTGFYDAASLAAEHPDVNLGDLGNTEDVLSILHRLTDPPR